VYITTPGFTEAKLFLRGTAAIPDYILKVQGWQTIT
jgi:hypothetical protein